MDNYTKEKETKDKNQNLKNDFKENSNIDDDFSLDETDFFSLDKNNFLQNSNDEENDSINFLDKNKENIIDFEEEKKDIKEKNTKWFDFFKKKKTKKEKKQFQDKITDELVKIENPENNSEIEEIEKIKANNELHETKENMQILEKIDVWKKNFSKINSEIKNDKNKFKKINPETLWDKMSFISKSVYKTVVIYLISLIWVLFWTVGAGWDKYSVWKFALYSLSIVLFLLVLQIFIYINNIKNKGNPKKIINYYIINTTISMLNIFARINFLLTPFFISSLLIAGGSMQTLKNANEWIVYGKLSVATSAPALSLLFAGFFYLPVNWGKIQNKIIESFGIFYLLSHLYLLKNYKNNPTQTVYKRAKDNWIKLNLVYNKPLGMAYHPEFLKTTNFLDEKKDTITKDERLKIIAKMKEKIQNELKNNK